MDFLRRDPLVNRELLLALLYDQIDDLQVVRSGAEISGVLIYGPGPLTADPGWIRIDARDKASAIDLLVGIDRQPEQIVSLHRPWIERVLRSHYRLRSTGDGMYGYFFEQQPISIVPDQRVRPLSFADRGLVEHSATGWHPGELDRLLTMGRSVWALIDDDRIVSRASSGYATPGCEEILGVWTAPERRGEGLARALVATITHELLHRVPFVAYTTTYDNYASQAVAEAVGFDRRFAAASYRWPDDPKQAAACERA